MRAVLTYHSIDESGSVVSVPEAAFRSHVEWLASGAVRVVPLEELLSMDDGVDAVAITFDDGPESFGAVAPVVGVAEWATRQCSTSWTGPACVSWPALASSTSARTP
jgi:hypothetical protein